KTVLGALAGLTGFVVTALALQELDPLRGVPDVKAQVHRARMDRAANVVFFGSSLTRRGLNPAVFDQRLAGAGIASHAFNCGVDGMTMPEILFLVDLVLRDLSEVKCVVLEASPVRNPPPAKRHQELSPRDIYWRSGRLTWLALRQSWQRSPAPAKAEAATRHEMLTSAVQLWFRRFVNLGRIAEFVDLTRSKADDSPAARPSPGALALNLPSDERGFLGVDSKISAKDRSELPKRVGEIPMQWEKAREDTVGAEALTELARRLKARGTQLVLVHPPDVKRRPAPYPSLAGEGVMELNFMDPVRYPELYSPEHRYDSRHLNREGATLYSDLLARELIPILDRGTL
ncbi:MAG TPA: hypothetical protein VF614_10480, partial [Chthoniobacteraceae bacterium]